MRSLSVGPNLHGRVVAFSDNWLRNLLRRVHPISEVNVEPLTGHQQILVMRGAPIFRAAKFQCAVSVLRYAECAACQTWGL